MPGSRRILQPGRSEGGRVIKGTQSSQPGGSSGAHGPTAPAPGRSGALPPGQGGIIPGLGLVIAALTTGGVPQPPPGDALQLIYSTTVSGTVASIDTGAGSIPGGYTHLLFCCVARTDAAGVNTQRLRMRFNNDSGANYNSLNIQGTGSIASSGNTAGQTGLDLGNMTGPVAGANQFGTFFGFIPGYSNTTFLKDVLCVNGVVASGNFVFDSVWLSAAAITRIAVYSVTGGNLVTGTVFSVYGL